MSTYYVDAVLGSETNSGLSEEMPKADWRALSLCPGDTVLLHRGQSFFGSIQSPSGEAGAPITWAAYGEGDAPRISAAVLLDSTKWVLTGTVPDGSCGIWCYDAPLHSEVGNLMFNDAAAFGTYRWEYEELASAGDFYDSGNGRTERPHLPRRPEDRLYLCCEKNPGETYEKIEAAVFSDRILATGKAHVVFRGLSFYGSGVHGFAAEAARDILIEDCVFDCIGGMAWEKSLRIRFGNGIEFWMGCNDITIRRCTVKHIYDSCFTHQGFLPFPTPENITVEDCRFESYGMAAYEVRDLVPLRTSFARNLCTDAGCGFAMQGETLPRRSEIWPQPMGHHLFIWRIDDTTEGGCLKITDNRFGDAPNGSAVYSIIDASAEKQFIFEGNTGHGLNACDIHSTGEEPGWYIESL